MRNAAKQDSMALLLRTVAEMREDIAGLRREVMDLRGKLSVTPSYQLDWAKWLEDTRRQREDAERHPAPWQPPVVYCGPPHRRFMAT